MHVLERNPWLHGLGVLLAVLVVFGGHARADVTTDQPGSIVIFPKVVSDGTRDTLIQLTNTSNMPVNVNCVSVNARGHCGLPSGGGSGTACVLNSDCAAVGGEICIADCTAIDFGPIPLTPQQPTVWLASTGRNSTDQSDGFFGGNVQPLGTDFVGELKCVASDQFNDAPIGGMLKGEASIISVSTPTGGTGNGAISTYNAIVIQGSDFTATDNQGVFQLDLDSTTADPTNHFNACPADLVANIRAEGATDPFTGGTIHNELTLIPCTEIFEQGVRPRFNVNMLITDEMEHTVSQLVPIDCMLNQRLDALSQQLGFPGTFGSAVGDFLKVRIKPPLNTRICLSGANACTLANFFANPPTANCNCTTDADCGTGQVLAPDGTALGCRPSPMVLGVVEEFQDGNGTFTGTTHEAANLHQEGQHPGDIMIFPFGTGGTP